MATNKHIIDIQTKGAAKSKREIQGITGSLSKMAVRAGAVAAAFYAAKGIISGITELSRQAAKVNSLERGFDNLGKKIGFNSQSFNKLNNAVNSTMKQVDLMTEANNAMMLGVVKSDDEMAQLFDTAQRLGQALGVDTAQAVNSLVTGMGRQSKLMLDNLGIMIDTNKAYEDYAKELGKASSQLTEQEKKLAFNNAVLKESGRLVANLGDEVLDNQSTFQQMDTAVDSLAIALGELFAPAVNLGAKAIAGLAEATTDAITFISDLEQAYGVEYIGAVDKATRSQMELVESFKEMKKFELVQTLMDLSPEFKNLGFVATEAALASGDFGESMEQGTITAIAFNEEQAQMIEQNSINAETFIALVEAYTQADEGLTALELTYSEFNVQMNQRIQQQQQELEFMDRRIETNPKVAKSLGMLTETQKRNQKGMRDMVSDLQVIGSEFKEFEGIAKTAAIAQTIFDTYSSAQKAFYNFQQAPAAKLNPPLYFGLGVAAAATATVAGLARVQQIRKAQYGADFVTDGPQMMMVGEGSGPERVQVTPLQDPNIDGPQAQGMTINIQGSVIGTEEFTENTLLPQIREGIRLGEQI
jgi:hypothetical protein